VGRRYEEAVHVRGAVDEPARPSAFVWHERLYVIREVLGHWHERTSWWEADSARAVLGEEVRVGAASVLGGADGREVWRVAASAGRQAGTGTYDLGCDADADGGAGERSWRLLQVVD
jgi:hypothetical protein